MRRSLLACVAGLMSCRCLLLLGSGRSPSTEHLEYQVSPGTSSFKSRSTRNGATLFKNWSVSRRTNQERDGMTLNGTMVGASNVSTKKVQIEKQPKQDDSKQPKDDTQQKKSSLSCWRRS